MTRFRVPPQKGHPRNDDGSVLLSTLFACSVMAILTGILTIMTEKYVEITQLYGFSQQVGWLARSEALDVLVDVRQGKSVQPFIITNVDGSKIKVTVNRNDPETTQVQVEATTQSAKSTVIFSYDNASRAVTSWMANA